MRLGIFMNRVLAAIGLATAALLGLLPASTARALEIERVMVVRAGDTLEAMLTGAGVDRTQAFEAVRSIAGIFPPKSLRPGQEVAIHFDPLRDDTLLELEVEPVPGRAVRARLNGERWEVEELVAPKHRLLAMAAGSTDGGLFPAATAAGLPPGLALSLVRTLSHQIDFQRDIQPGDSFVVLFERFRDSEGGVLGHGRALYVELTLSGKRLAFWRYQSKGGEADWYDEEGRSLRRSFLRTPLDGARVSSGFGLRRHPMLGFTRMHQGIDFAAPRGTQVYAAADGTVVLAGNAGGYGRMVRIRHAGGAETRYAHLSAFGRGIRAGRKVKQGDVIGRVGSTGMSTGPHLHYEVVKGGKAVNPATRTTQTVRLRGKEFAGFRAARRSLASYVVSIGPQNEITMTD